MGKTKHKIIFFSIILAVFLCAYISIFVDEAFIIRQNTLFRLDTPHKVIALTFDDGPSPKWTPRILDELKSSGAKATFFMIGEHVEKYPDIARRVAGEGHDIGIHTFHHSITIFHTEATLEKEIKDTAKIIRDITGKTTKLFRPPKAWMTRSQKTKIKNLGYEIVLWSLNSKDWVTFDARHIRRYILRHVQPGDIILFHDSGGVFSTEGGNRKETVKTLPRLIEQLKQMGYSFVTVSELLQLGNKNAIVR
ncbi:MAG: polysaccharide deacetylase family protein [Candidatus Omnitrophica bacterium]|nr:polysaccharide deacetylase family protein [Candidatus Omnitrophota bacterium]